MRTLPGMLSSGLLQSHQSPFHSQRGMAHPSTGRGGIEPDFQMVARTSCAPCPKGSPPDFNNSADMPQIRATLPPLSLESASLISIKVVPRWWVDPAQELQQPNYGQYHRPRHLQFLKILQRVLMWMWLIS